MSTPQQVAANLMRRAARVKSELRAAEGQVLDQAKRQAQALSSGPYSLKELRKMGHPYAKRAPNPPMMAGVVNVQSGQFRAAWSRKLGQFGNWWFGGMRSTLTNASPEAGYLKSGPRSKMIARPIWNLIGATIRPIRRSKLRAALRRALHG